MNPLRSLLCWHFRCVAGDGADLPERVPPDDSASAGAGAQDLPGQQSPK